MMDRLARQAVDSVQPRHQKISNLFQASFYFFYEDQFLPGIQAALAEQAYPRISRVTILEKGGQVVFDSAHPRKQESRGAPAESIGKEISSRLGSAGPVALVGGFNARVLMPGSQVAVLYDFDGSVIRNRVLAALVLGLALLALARWALTHQLTGRAAHALSEGWARFWRLRAKFLATIVLINLITAGIVFVSLVSLQTREQTQRIERDSILFSQFSTAQVISNFTNYFYFYYSDRFIPETKRIIASNENLVGLRIISQRTHAVLFDSEQSGPPQSEATDLAKTEFPPEVTEQLKSRDVASRYVDRGISVVSIYRNENQEPVFLVEYLFSFQSLARSIQAIRSQILVDLVPSLALGLLIAIVFAQLLLSPIRKLVAALGRVTEGDYDVTVDLKSRGLRGKDEVVELVTAFNSMTEELRKKKELRKYLSDSTYRQIMKAPDSPEGVRLGGSRVSATVLFSDIRNFVGHCEALEAEEVTAMLNEYFSEMVEVVYKNGGEVDKFIGDALLAVFYSSDESRTIRPGGDAPAAGAPTPSGTALQAIYCALEMRERLAEFNARRKAQQKATIEIGVGITHGEIISGPIGSKDRMDFTVIGDVVNLASRIEKLSKRGKHTKIVFSEQIESKVQGLLHYEEMGAELVQGKGEPVRTFELVGVRDIESLVRNIESGDLALRRRSVELLGQSRNSAALPHAMRALQDPDQATRLQAVLAVSKLAPAGTGAEEAAFAALLARLSPGASGQGERSDKVLSALIAAVGKLSGPSRIEQVIAALKPFLESTNERIVANAVEALGQARHPGCSDLILPKLISRNNRVKANAAMALFAAGHIEVIDTLKPMLMHSDPLMRSSAAFAIGELTVIAEQDHLLAQWKVRGSGVKVFLAELQECVPMLVALLRDPEPMVRRQAVIALGKIRDKSAVLPIIDMLDPERGSRDLIQDISQALRSIGSHKLVREVIARLSSS
jgi:class 3 adenylate cyclase/HEAT repeat protein